MADVHVALEGQLLDKEGNPIRHGVRKQIHYWDDIKSLAVEGRAFYSPGGPCCEAEAFVSVPRFTDGTEGYPRVKLIVRVRSGSGKLRGMFRLNITEARKFMEFVRSSDMDNVVAALDQQDAAYRATAEARRAEAAARRRRDEEFEIRRRRRFAAQLRADEAAPRTKTGKTERKKKQQKKEKQLADPC